jgi:hypothetical protein
MRGFFWSTEKSGNKFSRSRGLETYSPREQKDGLIKTRKRGWIERRSRIGEYDEDETENLTEKEDSCETTFAR